MKMIDLITWFDVNTHRPPSDFDVLIAHKEGGVMQARTQMSSCGLCFMSRYGDEKYPIDDDHPQITHWSRLPRNPMRTDND